MKVKTNTTENQTKLTAKMWMVILFLALLSQTGYSATFTVTTTTGNQPWCCPAATANDGSFLGALMAVNGSAGPHTINFNIPGAGPHVIDCTPSALPAITANTLTIDGTTQPPGTGNACNGQNIILASNGSNWNINNQTNLVIRGIGFQGLTIYINNSTNTTFQGCYFNLDATGTTGAGPNMTYFLVFDNSDGGTIGGAACAQKNVFNGAGADQAIVLRNGSDGVTVTNNYIGCDKTGMTKLGAGLNNHGIIVDNSINTTIDGNFIIGVKTDGIRLLQTVNNTTISDNIIGLNAAGTGTTFGVGGHGINFASASTANGTVITNNTIAKSAQNGIRLTCASNSVSITNNRFGLEASGVATATNYGNGYSGVSIYASMSNVTVTGNTFCRNGDADPAGSNDECGFYVAAGAIVTTLNFSNNFVGVDPSYTLAGNKFTGVFIFSASTGITINNNIIGDNGNAATKSNGLSIEASSTNVSITNNYIGIAPNSANIGNHHSGITISGGGNYTITGNYIGNNMGKRALANAGLVINGSIDHDIFGNYIGVAPNGTAAGQINTSADANGGNGILIQGASTQRIQIGSMTAGQQNTIANNARNGINVQQADFVEMRWNSIYCNTAKGITINCGTAAVANNSYGCTGFTITTFTPPVSSVAGTKPNDGLVDVFGTNQCGGLACGTNQQGQSRLSSGTYTTGAGTTWSYNNGSTIFNDISALVTGTTAGTTCNGGVCRTSEYTNCVDNTLPVSMLSFTATAQAGDVLLNWQTSDEINNAYFIIERSSDGRTFIPVGTVSGNGNTTTISNYSFTDRQAPAGVAYYRIKQVDTDGAYAYSDIEDVYLNSGSSVFLYPNPNKGDFTITSISGGAYRVDVLDYLGRNVYSTSFEEIASSEKVIDTDLARGIYLVHITSDQTQEIIKMVIE